MTDILVVDDAQIDLELCSYILLQNGYEVRTAMDGKQALECIHEQRPKLIITDVNMPVLNGLELCRQVKENADIADIPVLMVTSNDQLNDVLQGLNVSADGYLTKPFHEKVLLDTVNHLLDKPHLVISCANQQPDELLIESDGMQHKVVSIHSKTLGYFVAAYESAIVHNKVLEHSQSQIEVLNKKLNETINNLSTSQEQFRSLVHTIPDIVYRINDQGEFTFLNKAIEHLGYSQTELYGQHFSTIICEQDLDQVSSEKVLPSMRGQARPAPKLFDEHRTMDRMTQGLELRLKTKSGELTEHVEVGGFTEDSMFVEVNCSGLYSENPEKKRAYIGTVGVIRDIAKRKEVELQLQQAKEYSDRANKAKSEFLSAMSHELRTPLNSILGFAQLMQFNDKEPLGPSQSSSVAHIIQGGNHLLTLINEILDLAQIEAGRVKVELESISLMPLLQECVNLIQSQMAYRNVEIKLPEENAHWTVYVDQCRLRQILLNLLSNAVKYNREGGIVEISIEQQSESFKLNVKDSGMGIAKHKQEELFKPFSRLGAEMTDIEGTGIGLTVCRQLIDLIGGEIGFESEEYVGSTFWVTLPKGELDEEAQPQNNQHKATLPSFSGTVLYVEDNANNLMLMEMIVQGIKGLRLISAKTAEIGLELAVNEQPDLIILDINLPGMSGLEAVRLLAQDLQTSHIPVIALSASATQEDIEKGMNAGFRYYLTKPMQILEVVEVIRSILQPSKEL